MIIDRVFIVGAGLMGSGIAQVCAQAGIQVILHDFNSISLQKGLKSIAWSLDKLAEKGKVADDPNMIMGRIQTTDSFLDAVDANLAIEVVFEQLKIKQDVFRKLDEHCGPDAILASNTSAISITELASVTKKPERVLGLHFFSPVPMMQAVEVIRGQVTTQETAEKGRQFVVKIGKEPIMVNRDVAGFVINRINFPSTMEAMRLVERGIASVEDIDKGLRLASGRKMGIFETGDMVGLDVTYGAMIAMYQETGDPRWYPPLALKTKGQGRAFGPQDRKRLV